MPKHLFDMDDLFRLAADPTPFGRPTDNDDFEVDLTDAPSGGGTLIPAAKYPGLCVDLKKGHSKAGNPQWIWTFTILSGDYAGKEFPVFTALTPAALWKVTETVEALGIGKGGTLARFGKKDVLNRRCILDIQDDTYNNNTRSVVKTVLPHPDGPGPIQRPSASSPDAPI